MTTTFKHTWHRGNQASREPKYPAEEETYMQLTVEQLKNAIWTHNNGMVPIGGRGIEWYRNELFKLTGETKGYHEE